MSILALRLKGQLAENSKILSYHSTFPEQNHNEIEGWCNLQSLMSEISVIWLKDNNDSFFIKERMKIVEGIIDKYPNQQIDFKIDGDTVLEKVFAMINVIDWLSFYLAILYGTNPSPVNNISKLKLLMSND